MLTVPTRIARTTIVVGALTAATLGSIRRADGEYAEFARIVSAVDSSDSDEDLERRARDLARLPRALDSYFATTASGELGGHDAEPQRLSEAQIRLLERTAVSFSPSLVVPYVRQRVENAPDDAWRETALDLLGIHASSADLFLLAELVVEPGAATAGNEALLTPFTESLTEALRREGSSPRVLSWLADGAEPLRRSVIRAVGRAGDPEGLRWLVLELDEPQYRSTALQEIGRLAPRASSDLAVATSRGLHPLLRSPELGVRKHALRALGDLGLSASIPHLIQVLQSADTGGEHGMAHSALRRITRLELPAQAEAWTRWYEEEQRWLDEEGAGALERLDSTSDAEVVASIQALSARQLHRDRIARSLVPLLSKHPSPSVRGQVCVGLTRLGCREVASSLVDALEDEDRDVRGFALSALREFVDSPPASQDRSEWAKALQARERR